MDEYWDEGEDIWPDDGFDDPYCWDWYDEPYCWDWFDQFGFDDRIYRDMLDETWDC